MKILGISAFYHDAAAALVEDGKIIAAVQEERFTRIKHDPGFPRQAIRYCLEEARCGLDDLEAIVYYEKPFLKFERLLETYCAFAPRGLASFLKGMPVWIREKIFLKDLIRDRLKEFQTDRKGRDRKKPKLLFTEHHLSHAASAFYPSPFEKAAILTIDGVGEWATASIARGEEGSITVIKEMQFPHSLGLLYSAFTSYCGFEVNGGEYKLMGLAPYGRKDSEVYKDFFDKITNKLIDLQPDGSLFLHQEYFRYARGLRMTEDKKWKALFKVDRRKPGSPLDPAYCDMAQAIQSVTELVVSRMATEAKRLTGCSCLCMAGGVALNAVANGKVHGSGLFEDLFIQPAAGDAGGSLGAALAAYHIYFGAARDLSGRGSVQTSGKTVFPDGQRGSLLGPKTDETQILSELKRQRAVYHYYPKTDELLERTARLLAEGLVVGWHQGRMEFGPRALGARSILADPRDPGMQKKLNLAIKKRESFRPFAPIVRIENVDRYFELDKPSPYMLLVKQVRLENIPAVTHVDRSARIQTVSRDENDRLWRLLELFEGLTGCGVLVNTSFNVRDEPIVNTAVEAWNCLMNTEMDYLVIGNFMVARAEQAQAEPGGSTAGQPD